eukprot:jgi/Botrbrau1/22341/Bobra.0002s0019.1
MEKSGRCRGLHMQPDQMLGQKHDVASPIQLGLSEENLPGFKIQRAVVSIPANQPTASWLQPKGFGSLSESSQGNTTFSR